MKKNKRFNVIIITTSLMFFGFVYFMFLSPEEITARKNVNNIENICAGMTTHEVIEIMGRPNAIRPSHLNEIDSMYYYNTPFGYSEGIYIQYSSDNVVNEIIK